MTQKTKHICRCGGRAVVERVDTKKWFCLVCAADCMASEIEQGKAVSINLHEIGLTDIVVAPKDGGGVDLLASLVDVLPLSFCRN